MGNNSKYVANSLTLVTKAAITLRVSGGSSSNANVVNNVHKSANCWPDPFYSPSLYNGHIIVSVSSIIFTTENVIQTSFAICISPLLNIVSNLFDIL